MGGGATDVGGMMVMAVTCVVVHGALLHSTV